MLVKIKFANIINIAAREEIIPELLQSNCNANNIYKIVSDFLENPNKIKNQVTSTQIIIKKLKKGISSTELAAKTLIRFL